jgi:hypothetical protein
MPDAATVPQLLGRMGFLCKAKDRVRIRRAISGRMTIALFWACIFTLGRPVEASCHTPGKILPSVT